jgi:hypothetical protein
MRKHTRDGRSQPGILRRAARWARSLFSSDPAEDEWGEESAGGLGVREPRRPLHPTQSGAVALEPPPTETRDVWAVGDDDGR